jgi:hypothetical protein
VEFRPFHNPTVRRPMRCKGSRVRESKHSGDNAGHFRTNTPCRRAEHQFAVEATITVPHPVARGVAA